MYFDNNTIIYYNDKWVKATETGISFYTQTLHYGNGVFEGIRSYLTDDGVRLFKPQEHFDRLRTSAQRLQLPYPFTNERLIRLAYELLAHNHLTNAYVRPMVFAGINMHLNPTDEANLVIMAWKWLPYFKGESVALKTSSYRRPDPRSFPTDAKCVGFYANSVLATAEAHQKGFDDALLMDLDGFVAQTASANFFYQKGNTLFTAPLGNIFNGVTRAIIFELAESLNIRLQERRFRPEEVYGAEGAFLTGTATEVAFVHSLDKVPMRLPPERTIGYELAQAFRQLTLDRSFTDFQLV